MKCHAGRPGLIIVMVLALTGCMNLGPEYHRPEDKLPVPEAFQEAIVPGDQVAYDDKWWSIFNDPALNDYMDAVLVHNWDIERTAGRILELRALAGQRRADRYPQVDIDWQNRKDVRNVERPGDGSNRRERETFSTYNLSLPVFFEVDLWGRLARAEEAVRAELLGAEENRRAVAQTVVAEALALYFEIESIERGLAISFGLIDNFERNLRLVRRRYERGLASALDLRQARRILAESEATIPNLRRDLGTRQHRLSILMGKYPSASPPRQHPDDYYERLPEVPAGLPSDLLLRRPDIRVVEARLIALNARVAEALASRFPRITLTGSFGYQRNHFDQLFRSDSELWTFANGITQPVFDAGRLEEGQRAAEARYRQGVADYAQTVLTAFAEVEDALLTRREQLERRELVVTFLDEARQTQSVAEKRYGRGLTRYLDVLDAQRARFLAERDLVEADLALYINRINLYVALGGDWADPGEVPYPD
jgi:multidrug efflux system outer membrane protein